MRRTLTLVLPFAISTLAVGCKGTTEPGPPGPATGIVIASGNNQQADVGARLTAPLTVKVTDANGRGVSNQGVEFTVTSGFGQLSAVSTVTNAEGIAAANWTLGTSTTIPQRVTVARLSATTGLAVDSVLFRATALARPASRVIAWSGDGQLAFEHERLSDSLVVLTQDAFGNTVPNVQVTFTVTAGGGSVSPTTATTDANGRAATAFTLGGFSQPQQVRASAAGASVIFSAYARRLPEGTSVSFSGRPYALAVSSHDVVYVGRVDADVLTRFDGSSTTPTATVTVGDTPTEIAFNASGTKAYVTNQYSQNVSVVNVATNLQTETIPVSGNPFQVLVSPDETRIYVTTNFDSVYAINLATKTVVGQMATPYTSNGLAISADGSKLYVSTREGGSVIEVNTATMTALRTFTTGGFTQGVVITPDGAEMYVANEDGFLYAFNLGTGALAATIDLGGTGGFGIALSRDGTKVYVTVMNVGTVQVVNRATHAITRSYFVEGTPRRIGVTSDGTLVVANENGYVTWLR